MNCLNDDQKFSVSVIIATKNRQKDLTEAIHSIINQTIQPFEIIIIDQNRNDHSKKAVKKRMIFSPNIKLIYLLDNRIPGLTHARNLGVRVSKGNILIFLDDDVILEGHYIENIINAFRIDDSIYGISGIIEEKGMPIIKKLGYSLFCLGPFKEKRIEFNLRPKAKELTNMLPGCAAYRREVFNYFLYDENLFGYCPGEDKDFSYRVSKRFKLALIDKIRLFHKSSLIARDNKEIMNTRKTLSHFYFFEKNVEKNLTNWIFYSWLNLGFILTSLLSFDWLIFKGTLKGHKKIIRSISRKDILGELRTIYRG